MNTQPHSSSRQARQQGFTIVELMIAMVLGLLLALAMGQLFVGNKQSYRYQDALSRIQENGRFALERLSRDARMAGQLAGCLSQGDMVSNVLNSSYASRFLDADTPSSGVKTDSSIVGLYGANGSGGTFTPTLDSSITSAISTNGQTLDNNSDVLTLRLGVGLPVPVTAAQSAATAPLDVPANDLQQGQFAVVCDGAHATIFQVTDKTSNTDTQVKHQQGSPRENTTNNLQNTFGVGAEITPIATRTYYIASSSSGIGNSLWMIESLNAPVEVIDGIQSMQVLYGLKNDPADTSPGRYVDASSLGTTLSNWRNVASIRISLLARSQEDGLVATITPYTLFGSGGGGTAVTPTDRRIYRVFTRTIALRNRTN